MFVNCTAHSLTPDQINAAQAYSEKILDLKVLNPELYDRLIQCPPDENEIFQLAQTMKQYILFLKEKTEKLVVHFPIGSPYFMARFFLGFTNIEGILFVFSHSDRVSVDEKQPDGSIIKKGVFKFVKYLELVEK